MSLLVYKGTGQLILPAEYSYDPDESKYYSLTYRPPSWVADTEYIKKNHLIIPTTANGFMYECSSSGISGSTEPIWTTTENTSVTDNTVVWKAKAYNLLLRTGDTITSSTWTGTNSETIDSPTLIEGRYTKFRLTGVLPGATTATITNEIQVSRAGGGTEIFNRSIVIPIKQL